MNWCYGCMEQIEEGQRICPHCGYDNSRRQNDENLLREGAILNGKYLVGRKLGQGGFGVTYLGIELDLKIKVAIKEYFPKGMSSRASSSKMVKVSNDGAGTEGFLRGRDAFQKEAQTLALFNSPSIAHVREYFLENNTAYIVMDFVGGIGLDEAIKQSGGRMPWQRVVSLMIGMMPELDRLHKKNLVHRDIKPANLKIVTDEDTGKERLVLLDFGAARSFASAKLTGTFTMILTAGYAPFEQYQKRSHQGPYTDVYALCATMYKCITGSVPPAAPDRVGDNADPVVPITEFGVDVPDKVSQVIMHGLEFKSENRPQTMRELYDEFSTAIKEPEELDPREEIYQMAFSLMDKGDAAAFNQALKLFDQINGYKDANRLKEICLQKEYEFQSQKIYDEARSKMVSNTKAGYEEALRLFDQISGYLDANDQADICRKRIDELNEKSEPESQKKKSTKPVILLLVILAAVIGVFILVRDGQEKHKAAAVKVTATPSPYSLYSLGEDAYQAGNFSEALEYLIPAAEAGVSEAQFRLGYMFGSRQGVEQSYEQAYIWYQMSADQGNEAAQNNLGVMYEFGNYVEQSYKQAAEWYRKAADQGDPTAQCNLGTLYERGLGVTQSDEKALELYQKAAKQGYERAQQNMKKLQDKMNQKSTPTPAKTQAVQTKSTVKVAITPTSAKPTVTATPVKPTVTPKSKRSHSGVVENDFLKEISDIFAEGNSSSNSESDFSNLKEGDIITFGSYEQDNNTSNGPEPIDWIVLKIDKNMNRALGVSKMGLESKGFDDVVWCNSETRNWLNNQFYNTAFTTEEKNKIMESQINNLDNRITGAKGCSDTTDKIFLLSMDEFNYFSNANMKICKLTEYAKSHGGWVSNEKGFEGNGYWWLRTPGYQSSGGLLYVSYVNAYGNIIFGSEWAYSGVIRPAFWIVL